MRERGGWHPEGMCTVIRRMLGRVWSNIMQIQRRSDRRKHHKITVLRWLCVSIGTGVIFFVCVTGRIFERSAPVASAYSEAFSDLSCLASHPGYDPAEQTSSERKREKRRDHVRQKKKDQDLMQIYKWIEKKIPYARYRLRSVMCSIWCLIRNGRKSHSSFYLFSINIFSKVHLLLLKLNKQLAFD